MRCPGSGATGASPFERSFMAADGSGALPARIAFIGRHVALLAWLVFPLLAGAICVGVGLLAERLAGARLEPALLAPLRYAAAIAALAPLFATGAGAVPALVLLVVLAVAGFALAADRRRLRPGAGAIAAAVV